MYQTTYLAQDVFKRAILATMDNVKYSHLYLDTTAPKSRPTTHYKPQHKSVIALVIFNSLYSRLLTPPHIGIAVYNVFTGSSLELTNARLGNWGPFQERNFFQSQNLSHVNKNRFTEFLQHTLPSVGRGHFLMTTRIAPFSLLYPINNQSHFLV